MEFGLITKVSFRASDTVTYSGTVNFVIGYLEGVASGEVVLTPGGVGYEVRTPTPLTDGPVQLHVHTVMHENSITLYGFEDVRAKKLFIELLSVRGVGGKAALAILGSGDFEYVTAGLRGEVSLKVRGVGQRTLDKIRGELSLVSSGAVKDEVTQALVNLGFDESTSAAAVAKARGENPGADEETIITRAVLNARTSS